MKSILKYFGFVAIIMSFTLVSCKKDCKDSNTCNVSNPAEDLNWLKQDIDDVRQDKYAYYSMATYNGETVFYYGSCDPQANYISKVKNCSGDDLGHFYELKDDLSNVSIIWNHPDTNCDF